MLKRSLVTGTVVALFGAAIAGQAHTRASQGGHSAASSNAMVHVEGCVFPEAALTATKPVIVPAGTTQTYVLTNVKLIAGSIKEDEATKTTYTLAKGDQDQLRSLNGKRVGVVGHVAQAANRPGLSIVSIREISGGCPTLPTLS